MLKRNIKGTILKERNSSQNVFMAQSRNDVISDVGVTLFFIDENDGNQAFNSTVDSAPLILFKRTIK